MAKSAGGKGGGGKGGGKGKQTARSQNYLRQYGYPSSRELRREAEGTAGASVSSIHEVRQPFKRQAQSAKDFLAAVQSVLSETQGQVGAGYDQATSQQAALDAATQQRLAGLGLGVDSAGVQAASGARGDSATANLLSNAASAKAYAASQPGIAAGNTGVVLAGLRKQETDALATRRDQLRQSFFAALQNAQQNALAHASFNQSADQFAQNMSLQQRQLADQEAATKASTAASAATAAQAETHWRLDFIAKNGFDPYTGKKVKGVGSSGGMLGLTASEFAYQRKSASAVVSKTGTTTYLPIYAKVNPDGKPILDPQTGKPVAISVGTKPSGDGWGQIGQRTVHHGLNFAQQGLPFLEAVHEVVRVAGVKEAIAEWAVASAYRKLKGARQGSAAWKAWASYYDYIKQPRTQIGAAEAGNTGLTGPH